MGTILQDFTTEYQQGAVPCDFAAAAAPFARAHRAANGYATQPADLALDVLSLGLTAGGALVGALFLAPSAPTTTYRFLNLPYAKPVSFLLLYSLLIVLCLQAQEIYARWKRPFSIQVAGIVKAVLVASAMAAGFGYVSGARHWLLVFAYAAPLNIGMLTGWRAARRQIRQRRMAEGRGGHNVLIVGAGRIGQALARYFEHNQSLGYRVKGFVDQNHVRDPRILGRIEDLSEVILSQFVDEVFITIPSERGLVKEIAAEARSRHVAVNVVPELFDGMGLRAPIDFLGDFPVMELHREPIPFFGLLMKRALDVAGALAGLALAAPVMLLTALAIKLDSAGPVFYKAPRIGKKGSRFTCYKFRSMVANADELKDELRHLNERAGPTFKISDDPRITRRGRFIRKYSLDELPQLFNVLRGEMSLVGPRPHPVDDFEQYSLDHLRRLDVKPGVTGLWQVTAREDPSFEKNMELDLEYIESWSLALDLKVLGLTVPVVVKGLGH
jgi:exopolysaccharide biosynthesis polyprenyl glycosylphosphotransferase